MLEGGRIIRDEPHDMFVSYGKQKAGFNATATVSSHVSCPSNVGTGRSLTVTGNTNY